MRDKIKTRETAGSAAKPHARQQSMQVAEQPQATIGRALNLRASQLTPAQLLAMQGTIGNRAVQRVLSELTRVSSTPQTVQTKLTANATGDKPEQNTQAGTATEEQQIEDIDTDVVDTSGNTGEELAEIPKVKALLKHKEEIIVGGESHTLSFRLIDGELELGMASLKWTRLNEIDTLVHERVAQTSANYRQAWRDLADARRDHKSAARALAGVERQIRDLLPAKLRNKPHRAILRGLKNHPYKLAKYRRLAETVGEQEVLLQQAAAEFQQQARQYINTAFTEHGPDIGDILAHLAPTRTAAPHHALNVAANTYRYHEGTVLDPIPIIWYKPQNQYPNLLLNAYDGAGNIQNFNLAYPGGGTVYDRAPGPNRLQYDFGIAGGNQVPGNLAANAFDIRNARQAYTRATQQELNQVIQNFGFNMNNRDGDHVKDLGFGGLDRIDNFWPLPRAVNQRAMVWRQAYRFHFKEQDNHGNWVLRSGTVNGLPGKYFRIKGEENQDVPAESNGVAAGNTTTYGNAQVIGVNGVNVQEA